MAFEWDENKDKANQEKHGISFSEAKELFSDPNAVRIPSTHVLEARIVLIAQLNDKIWAACYTMRGENIRIISVRRAREEEAYLYE